MLELTPLHCHDSLRRAALQRWLEPFCPTLVRHVLDRLDDASVVIGPTSELVHLAHEPDIHLPRLGAKLTRLATDHPDISSLLYLLNAEHPAAPTLNEVEAVLGAWLHVEVAAEANDARGWSRMLVQATFREEYLAICLTMPPLGVGDLLSCLNTLTGNALPIAALFVTRDQALRLRQESSPLGQCLTAAVRSGLVTLGLYVPAQDQDRAVADLVEEVRPLRELAGDRTIGIIRFSPPPPHSASVRLNAEMRRAGFAADASFGARVDPSRIPLSAADISYFAAGAYQPQLFDLSSPTGHWRSDDPIAIVALSLGYQPISTVERSIRDAMAFTGTDATRIAIFSDWDSLWAYRSLLHVPDLSQRIRYMDKQAYLAEMPNSLPLQQSYDEFMIYNWPPSDPPQRVTLVDGGVLDRPERIAALLRETASFVTAGGQRRRLVGQAELLAAAKVEAQSRVEAEVSSSLELQRREHGYLERTDNDQLLREDLEGFLGFLPNMLGRTLEIGSGYGQLARALTSRATQYICLELVEEMVADLEIGVGTGIVADAHHLPFHDRSVESIVANNSLEHLYDPLAALREMRRVLKRLGHLFAIVPLDRLAPKHALRTHLWKADPAGIESVCATAGLAVRRLEIVDLLTLGVAGSFPTCRGLVAMLDAEVEG